MNSVFVSRSDGKDSGYAGSLTDKQEKPNG